MRVRWISVASFALLSLGCAEVPELVATGESESPCRSDVDCVAGLFCIDVDGATFCTPSCDGDEDCGEGYACSSETGVCAPERAGACRAEETRCGPSFPPCCGDVQCVQLSPHGQFCARRCVGGCDLGLCCAATPGGGVCVPQLYCE